MLTPILMQVILVIMVSVISLNECLQGSGKSQIRRTLFTLHLVVILVIFGIFGWKWGLISLATVLLSGVLLAPVSTWAAVKIFGDRASPELTQRFSAPSRQREDPVSQEQLGLLLEEYGLTLDDIAVWPTVYEEEWNFVIRNLDALRYMLSLLKAGENQLVIAAKVRQRCLGSGYMKSASS